MHHSYVFTIFFILLLAGCSWGNTTDGGYASSSQSSWSSNAESEGEVVISEPTRGKRVSSPLTVRGEASGTWFFEASIPVQLIDENGNVIASTAGQVDGGWMTVDLIEFTATLHFEKPTVTRGFLVIRKDNPSGLPENDGEYRVPVRF